VSAVDSDRGAPAAPAVRGLLALAAVLVFLAGVQLFVFPLDTETRFAWTIGSPMTAVFLGASYWSAVGLEASGAMARDWAVARVALPAVFVFTSLTLVVTLVHLENFHLSEDNPAATRAVTWAWLAVYALVPLLMVVARVVQGRRGTAVPPAAGLPAVLRVTLAALAAVLLVVGVALLVAPEPVSVVWPWTLTPLTGRAVGAWCVGLGVAAAHAWMVDDPPSLRPVGVTGVVFGVLQGWALLRYGDELDWGSVQSVGYLVVLIAIFGVGVGILLAGRAGRRSG
jgi:hypothetical protein